jgi:hypothetical protein
LRKKFQAPQRTSIKLSPAFTQGGNERVKARGFLEPRPCRRITAGHCGIYFGLQIKNHPINRID